jgi:hypothetical protein
MESKEEMYLQRARSATHAARWAENSGVLETAELYRKFALLWQEMALLEKRRPVKQV